jgi:hypothetical protein
MLGANGFNSTLQEEENFLLGFAARHPGETTVSLDTKRIKQWGELLRMKIQRISDLETELKSAGQKTVVSKSLDPVHRISPVTRSVIHAQPSAAVSTVRTMNPFTYQPQRHNLNLSRPTDFSPERYEEKLVAILTSQR